MTPRPARCNPAARRTLALILCALTLVTAEGRAFEGDERLPEVAATAGQDKGGLRPRPNVVMILADDLGYGDLGSYNPRSKIPTPNLDRLAAQGTRFTDAHAPAAVCTPTRYGLLTGRYCWRTRLKTNVLGPWGAPLIEPGRLTLPALFRRHGYTTACLGKWHPAGPGPRETASPPRAALTA
jgi:arylsulfatase A-like enzyme